MTTPEDFEQELAARLEQAGDAVAGEGTTLDGVIVRHRERARARRVRQGAVAAVAAGVMAVAGIGFAAGDEGGGATQVAAEGSSATDGPSSIVAPEACGDETLVVVFLRPGASEVQVQAVAEVLEGRFGPEAVSFVGQEEAFEEAQARFSGQPAALDVLRPEDVPASFRVALLLSGRDAASLRDEVQELVTGSEVRSVEIAWPATEITVPPSSSSTTTTVAGSGLLTEEQVRALVAYVRGLHSDSSSAPTDHCYDGVPPSTVAPSSPGGETTMPPPAPSTTEEPVAAPPTTEPPTSTTIPAWPAVVPPEHGGPVWAAYLVVGPQEEGEAAPDMRRVGDLARGLGYEPGVSDLACDQGAAEALGLDLTESYLGLSLYFATEDEARSFAERFRSEVRGEVRGVVQVRTLCLD